MSQKILPAAASKIYQTLVKKYRDLAANPPPGFNPIRATNTLYHELCHDLAKANISTDFWPINLTIGTIEPRKFNQEVGFETLAAEMGLDPQGVEFQKIMTAALTRWSQNFQASPDESVSLTSYDPLAAGTLETRESCLAHLVKLGFKLFSPAQIFLCAGGMDGLARASRSLINNFKLEVEINFNEISQAVKNNFQIEPKITTLFPVPGFKMTAVAAKLAGSNVVTLTTLSKNDFSLTSEELSLALKNNPETKIIILTPFNNPTSKIWEEKKLIKILSQINLLVPQAAVIFDMAYAELVDPVECQKVVQAIQNQLIFARSLLVFSSSKHLGNLRLRGGYILAGSQALADLVQLDTLATYPSVPILTDLVYGELLKYFDAFEVSNRFRALLLKRKTALLAVLQQINLGRKIFLNLAKIDLQKEVPLYLYAELADGTSPWDLAELGILGVPGSAFGGTNQTIRFSLGVITTMEINKLAEIFAK